MAVYKLVDNEFDIAKDRVCVRQPTQRYGRVIRAARYRKPWRMPPGQRATVDSLVYCARLWTCGLTAAQKLQWGTASNDLVNRSGVAVSKNRYSRWIQVQTPLHYAGKPLEATGTKRTMTQIRSLQIAECDPPGDWVRVSWDWKRSGPGVERSTLLFSQVPPDCIATPHLYQYARLCHTYDTQLQLTGDIWYTFSRWFQLPFPVSAAGEIQLYIRNIRYKHDNPPISTQESHETTEDWTALIHQVS